MADNISEKSEKFEYAVSFILGNEGGYNNDPDDSGGATKFGISQRSYPKLDIQSLSVEKAKALYKKDFWEAQLYDDIKDIRLATKIFDLAVNVGSFWAHRILQRALRSTGQDIKEDGILGAVTLSAINRVDSAILHAALKSESAGYYRTLAAMQPEKAKFLKGWLRRAYKSF